MTNALLIVIALVALVHLALALLPKLWQAEPEPETVLASRLRQTVIVHTQDSKSIRGILVEDYKDGLVLAHPEFLSGATPASLGGELLILRENVSIAQDVEPARVEAGALRVAG